MENEDEDEDDEEGGTQDDEIQEDDEEEFETQEDEEDDEEDDEEEEDSDEETADTEENSIHQINEKENRGETVDHTGIGLLTSNKRPQCIQHAAQNLERSHRPKGDHLSSSNSPLNRGTPLTARMDVSAAMKKPKSASSFVDIPTIVKTVQLADQQTKAPELAAVPTSINVVEIPTIAHAGPLLSCWI